MLPYLIAGAIGFGIAKLFEEGGETFGRGGMTNEDILRSFLTSEKEIQFNNLSTQYNSFSFGDFVSLFNYTTLIALRKGNNVKITKKNSFKTTNTITNRLKALAEEMGYNVSYVSKFENGGEMFMAGGKAGGRDLGDAKIRLNELDSDGNTSVEYDEENDEWYWEDYSNDSYRGGFSSELEAYNDLIDYLENNSDEDKYVGGGGVGDWSVSDITNAKYLGYIEFQDNEGEFHNFEVMETDDRLVFGGMTNIGFIESGYIEKDGFSTDETLQSLIEDLEVYYNDGAEYTSQIVFNQRMAEGGEAKKRRRRANAQIGKTDRSVDKTRVAKPVGYRFTNALASKLRKDKYAVPTEKQITKYLGKGIYKENRRNKSDRDRTAKL